MEPAFGSSLFAGSRKQETESLTAQSVLYRIPNYVLHYPVLIAEPDLISQANAYSKLSDYQRRRGLLGQAET